MSKTIDAFFNWLGDVTANGLAGAFILARRAALFGLAGCMCGAFAAGTVLTFNSIVRAAAAIGASA